MRISSLNHALLLKGLRLGLDGQPRAVIYFESRPVIEGIKTFLMRVVVIFVSL